jgi:hypothetical protein
VVRGGLFHVRVACRDRLRHHRRAKVGNPPLGDSLDVFIRREDAERFIEDTRSDDPELAESLRIEERELRRPESNTNRLKIRSVGR